MAGNVGTYFMESKVFMESEDLTLHVVVGQTAIMKP
jgi:hypothetical protein